MIPTYNCAGYLRETLQSVLAQYPGAEKMQIAVVDDCSTKDDPEAVVRELGQGRVAFYRQPENGGAIRNFNTCIRRARGQWVHVLHGDDAVEPGFYGEMERQAERFPQAMMLMTRCHIMDESSKITSITPPVFEPERLTNDPAPLYYANRLAAPGVVVRRSFFERHGGFFEHLVHTADWEMWCRAVARGGGVMVPGTLARYRESGTNESSRWMRSGENIRDSLRLAEIFSQEYGGFNVLRFRGILRLAAADQIRRYRRLGDWEAVEANVEVRKLIGRGSVPASLLLRRFIKKTPLLGTFAAAMKRRLAMTAGSPSTRLS
jgi:GT2 family glycosyltransferase